MIPSISFRHLQYFVAVFEEGSFTKAAERERCTQPALSAQIRNVEGVVGASLFDRSVTGVVPTAAGKRFYRHAISILRSLRVAQLEMAGAGEQISGAVRAGLIPSLVRGILPAFLPEFVEKHPAIDLHITESFSGTLTDWLLAQELDLAVVVEPPRHEGLEMEKLAEGPAVLITGRALGLSPGPVQLSDLPPLKMILPGRQHSLREIIERSIWTRSLKVTRVLEMDSVPGMIAFVRASDWATILPFVAVVHDLDDANLVLNPIAAKQFETDLYLVHLTQFPLSLAALEFAKALRAEANRAPCLLLNGIDARITANRPRVLARRRHVNLS
jgi:LysR family nitrogen assimilation transcriptional regulator